MGPERGSNTCASSRDRSVLTAQYVGCLRDPSTAVEHGNGKQQARGAKPFTTNLTTNGLDAKEQECRAVPQVTESACWIMGIPQPQPVALTTDFRILMPAGDDQTASHLTTPPLTSSSPRGLLDELLPASRVPQEMSQGGTIRRFRWC